VMDNNQVGILLAQFKSSMVWEGLKWLYYLAFGVYLIFAVIVLTQIRQMVRALSGGFGQSIKLLGWLHLGVALLAFFMSIVLL
jgi:hypothetical protein